MSAEEVKCCGTECCGEQCSDQCCGNKCCEEECCGKQCCGDQCCGNNCCGDNCCNDNCCEDDEEFEPLVEEDAFPKTIIQEGRGYEKPSDDCLVVVDYVMKMGETIIEQQTDFTYKVGDMPVICEGFEKGVESMKSNEICEFTLEPKDAFGVEGDKTRNIPSNAEITFRVTLKKMEPVPTPFTIAPEDIVKHAENKKLHGNEMVKKKLHKRALRCYLRGLDYLDNDYRIPEDQKENAKKVQTLLFSNVAAMYLHLKEYYKVIEYAEKVLTNDSTNLKAYLRRGKAYLENGHIEKAQKDFDEVLKIDPQNKEVKNEMMNIKKKQQLEDKKDKQRYARMFGALGSLSEVDAEQKKRQEEIEERRKKEWEEIKRKQEENEAKDKEQK